MKKQFVNYVQSLHEQNLSGRETFQEAFVKGIEAAWDEILKDNYLPSPEITVPEELDKFSYGQKFKYNGRLWGYVCPHKDTEHLAVLIGTDYVTIFGYPVEEELPKKNFIQRLFNL